MSLLTKFVATANNSDNSHFCHFQGGGVNTLSDAVSSSPILFDMRNVQNANQNQGGPANDFGEVDPDIDPELAMVMRISLEEERQRQKQL